MITGKEKSLVVDRKNCNEDLRSTLPTDVDFVFDKDSSREVVLILFICHNFFVLFFSEFLPILVFSYLHPKFSRSFLSMMDVIKRNTRFYFKYFNFKT